jgi:hypothetical protein
MRLDRRHRRLRDGRRSKVVSGYEEASVKAADTVTDATSKTFKRMQHYLAEKDVLQTFHDAGEHSEAAVLDVLHKSKAHASTGTSKATPHATGPAPAAKSQSPHRPRQFRRSMPAIFAGPSMRASSAPSLAPAGASSTRESTSRRMPASPCTR